MHDCGRSFEVLGCFIQRLFADSAEANCPAWRPRNSHRRRRHGILAGGSGDFGGLVELLEDRTLLSRLEVVSQSFSGSFNTSAHWQESEGGGGGASAIPEASRQDI